MSHPIKHTTLSPVLKILIKLRYNIYLSSTQKKTLLQQMDQHHCKLVIFCCYYLLFYWNFWLNFVRKVTVNENASRYLLYIHSCLNSWWKSKAHLQDMEKKKQRLRYGEGCEKISKWFGIASSSVVSISYKWKEIVIDIYKIKSYRNISILEVTGIRKKISLNPKQSIKHSLN